MKQIIMLVAIIFLLTTPVYANAKEIIAEGTYVMTEKDTLASAEEAALIAAKRAALEQTQTFMMSTTTIRDMKLVDDQIRALSVGVIEATVLDKSRTYNGNSLVFWVKIKANVSTDKLAEAIQKGFKSLEKQVMGIVTIVDIDPKAKFDLRATQDKKYTFAQFEQEFRPGEPFNQAFASKYASRSLITESKDSLANYFKEAYSKNQQLTPAIFAIGAEQSDYDYVLVNVLKFNRIERITGTAFFTLSMQMYWKVEATNTCYLYDRKNDKIIFTDSAADKRESQYPAGSWLVSVPQSAERKALEEAIGNVSRTMIDKITSKLPNL